MMSFCSLRRLFLMPALCAGILSAGALRAGEVLDNAKVVQLVKDGVALEVIQRLIEKATTPTPGSTAAECRFDDSTTSIGELQKVCKEAQWTKEDIATLQKKIIEMAGRDQKALKELVDRALNVFENADVAERESMMRVLSRQGKRVVPYLMNNVEQDSERKRAGVVEAIGRIGDKSPEIVHGVTLMLTDRAKPVREKAARAVVALAGPQTSEMLVNLVNSPTEKVDGAALALGYLRDEKAVLPLTKVLRLSSDSDAKVCAAFALGELRAKQAEAVEALLECVLDERDEKLRDAAALALSSKIYEKRAPNYIIKAFHRFRQGRAEIVRHLAYFKDINVLKFLVEECENEELAVKRAVVETLILMTGEKEDDKEGWRSVVIMLEARPDWQQAPEPKIPDARRERDASQRNADGLEIPTSVNR